MINIISKRYWFFLISALIIVPGLVSLIARPHLNLGTDFQSGTAMTLQFDTDIQESALREALTTAGYQEATIQYSPSSKEYFVSIRATTTAEWEQLQRELQASINNTLHV